MSVDNCGVCLFNLAECSYFSRMVKDRDDHFGEGWGRGMLRS